MKKEKRERERRNIEEVISILPKLYFLVNISAVVNTLGLFLPFLSHFTTTLTCKHMFDEGHAMIAKTSTLLSRCI